MSAVPGARLHALGEVTGKRVLELGCGAGQWSRSLAAEGAIVAGFDPPDWADHWPAEMLWITRNP